MKARIVPYRDDRHRLRRFRRFRERHHAISYLDNIVSAKGDGAPHDMAGWYRLKLLLDDQGCAHIIGHLRRELAAHREPGAGNKDDDGGEGDLEAHLETAETAVTPHGTKLNQIIPITGANGKTIDVTFAWIRNNDGVVRLVTGIPAKK